MDRVQDGVAVTLQLGERLLDLRDVHLQPTVTGKLSEARWQQIRDDIPLLVEFAAIDEILQPHDGCLVEILVDLDADAHRLREDAAHAKGDLVRDSVAVEPVDNVLVIEVLTRAPLHREREERGEVHGHVSAGW